MKHLGVSGFAERVLLAGMVVAISAIVAPVLSPSRSRSKEQGCMDNLKRIGLAARMYADDYDGYIYPQVYNEAYWKMPAGTAPPASATFDARIWATAYLPYCGNNSRIFRCPFDDGHQIRTDQGNVSFKYGPGLPDTTPESAKKVSYIYIGLDIWKSGTGTLMNPATAFRYMRRISDATAPQSTSGGVGWLARDKVFSVATHLATFHSVSPYPVSDSTNWMKGVESNVLLLDGRVQLHTIWDG
jgi:hypothetical protein